MPRVSTERAHGFGWKKDPHDHRDWHYERPTLQKKLRAKVDFRPECPPVYEQKGLNSCSANAVAAAIEFELKKQKLLRVISPSRLFIYYNSRAIERTEKSNTGVYIRDAIKAVASKGDCPESLWPYVEKNYPVRPPEVCYQKALRYQAVKYYRIHRDLDDLRACLDSGYPFVFGFTAHEGFQGPVKKTGVLELPSPGEKVIGKHAVLAVGYNDREKRFYVRNSWGPRFGLKGYFTMPYAYLLRPHLTADFWTIRVVS
jgi:C1A family cysteine protease